MTEQKKIHFIAIGGSIMSSLAVVLKKEGHLISGSDDELYDPTKSMLQRYELLPKESGWFPEKLDDTVDLVILGMHAKKNNPELLKAQELGLPLHSFPDYILSRSQDKQRIVIGGSHGKTTITALVIHTLAFYNRNFDYIIGAQVEGLENTVQLTDAPIILIEGDEYLASHLDPTPKFLKYHHHIAVISGIEWDHANVFPSKEEYVKSFNTFADTTPKAGTLIYNAEDPISKTIGEKVRTDVTAVPYTTHDHVLLQDKVFLKLATESKKENLVPIQLFGTHNLQNISAACEVLKIIGITVDQFYKALPGFKGAAGRLSKVFENNSTVIYKDFAHAPSKVHASTKAVKAIYPTRELVGCLELHTLSSLNKNFISEYRNTMDSCTTAIVYYNAEKIQRNNIESPTNTEIHDAFGDPLLKIFTNASELETYLTSIRWTSKNLLMMSSGNFNGLNLNQIAQKISAQ